MKTKTLYAVDVSTDDRERTLVVEDIKGREDFEHYALSENQQQFIEDADDSGLKVDYWYSGRGMYGKYCPSVKVEQANDLRTKAKVREDSLGMNVVIYAQN